VSALPARVTESWHGVSTKYVGLKLASAFGILLATLIAVGFFGLRRMDQSNAELQEVLDKNWSKVQLAREALSYSSQNSRITMQVFFLEDKQQIPPLLETRSQNTQSITSLLAKIDPLCESQEEKDALAKVKNARAPYVASYLRALHLLLDENRAQAGRTLMAQETTPDLFRYHAAWNDFLGLEMQRMDRAVDETREHFIRARKFSLAMIVLAVAVTAGTAVFVTLRMMRELKVRIQAECEIKNLNEALESRVAERTYQLEQAEVRLRSSLEAMEQYNKDIVGVNELIQLMQSCLTLEEAYAQAAKVLPRFFKAGALMMLNRSRNMLDSVAAWGSVSTQRGPFPPDSCWALRRGRAHVAEPANFGLFCAHLDEPGTANHLCLPMIAQGDSLGILYVQDPSPDAATSLSEHTYKFAVMLAEQMSLAFANLLLRETLKYQSVCDPLTGLFNRRYMEESLERELLRAARTGKPVALLMIDVDHFKQFNDSLGHEAGDILLREAAALFSRHIRGGDIACRYGGEEFLLILADAGIDAAYQRAETLRESVCNLQISHRGQTLRKVSISVGIAAFPNHGELAQQIINAADAALYRAKHNGRDQVVIAGANQEALASAPGSR